MAEDEYLDRRPESIKQIESVQLQKNLETKTALGKWQDGIITDIDEIFNKDTVMKQEVTSFFKHGGRFTINRSSKGKAEEGSAVSSRKEKRK